MLPSTRDEMQSRIKADQRSLARTGSVRVRFADGKECTLTVHGIGQLQFLGALDEIGVKSWSELTGTSPSLQSIRLMFNLAAVALSFPGQESWTVEKIQNSFADAEQAAKVFNKCLELSNFARPNGSKSQPRPGAYS
jgi:hypothetical protein